MIAMNKSLLSAFAWTGLGLVLYVVPALAQGGKLIDVFNAWSAFTEKENGKAFCYIGSLPEKMEGKYTQRGDALILVTHRPAEKSFDVISIQAGYIYHKESEVKVTIGGQSFELYTKGDQSEDRPPVGGGDEGGQDHGRQGNVEPRHADDRHLFPERLHCRLWRHGQGLRQKVRRGPGAPI